MKIKNYDEPNIATSNIENLKIDLRNLKNTANSFPNTQMRLEIEDFVKIMEIKLKSISNRQILRKLEKD